MLKRLLVIVAVVGGVMLPTAAQAAPASTTNCTPYFAPKVCITVLGSGLHVDSISVGVRWAQGYNYYGLYKVLKNNTTWKVSPIFGGTGSGAYKWWTWTINANFANGTVMCGQHTDPYAIGYKPCATIHS